MFPAVQRFFETTDLIYVLVNHIADYQSLLRFALVNHLVLSVSARTLNSHLLLKASSLLDPSILRNLTDNPHLHHVQFLEVDVGGRPSRDNMPGFGLGKMTPPHIAISEYHERSLPQFTAAMIELLSRMPGLLTFRWFGDDIPLEVIRTLQDKCPRLQDFTVQLRRFYFGPAAFPRFDDQASMQPEEMGPPLAMSHHLGSFVNLTSLSVQRIDYNLEDWVELLVVLGQKSPRLAHLSLSRDPSEYYAKEPLSIEELSNRYSIRGGRPLHLQSLHLRDGFQFSPLSNERDAIGDDARDPIPYLTQLTDTSVLEALSVHIQRGEDFQDAGSPVSFYPVPWSMLSPKVLPRLQSLWISILNREAYTYLHDDADADWLSSLDLTIGKAFRPARPDDVDFTLEIFFDCQKVGPTFRRTRSIILPELRRRDMVMVEGYGAVQHMSANLNQHQNMGWLDLRSFLKLKDLESIHLVYEGNKRFMPVDLAVNFVKELASACPKLRYARLDVRSGSGKRFQAWSISHQDKGAVLHELGTLEELAVRPKALDEAIKAQEIRSAYTPGRVV